MSAPPQDLCREALQLLEKALGKPPPELSAEVDVAEQKIAQLRDELIDRLRAAPDQALRAALDNVNAALSLVVGVEYPVGGVQRDMLKQARTALDAAQQHCPTGAAP